MFSLTLSHFPPKNTEERVFTNTCAIIKTPIKTPLQCLGPDSINTKKRILSIDLALGNIKHSAQIPPKKRYAVDFFYDYVYKSFLYCACRMLTCFCASVCLWVCRRRHVFLFFFNAKVIVIKALLPLYSLVHILCSFHNPWCLGNTYFTFSEFRGSFFVVVWL